jgi:hypothetical protein
MVRPIITAAVALLIFAARAGADLDLTPIDSYYVVEGTRAPNLNFHDGGKVVSYTPPGHWKPGGAGKQMTLMPEDKVQASASIEALPARDLLPATEDNLKAYSDRAVALLPHGVSDVTVVGAAVSSVHICTYALAEVTITYKFFGQEFETVVFFMPRPVEEVRFRLSCHAADFKDLYKPFLRSLFSIQGL